MKALIQRVSRASVRVDNRTVSSIGPGLLILLGVMKGDTDEDLAYLVRKIEGLRIFGDAGGRMNLPIKDKGGEALVVSQFTLAGQTRKGNRPSFTTAEEPARAREVYHDFMERLGTCGIRVSGGEFAAHMEVELINDGPVTIMIDSREKTH